MGSPATWWRPFWGIGLVGLVVGLALSVLAWWLPSLLAVAALLGPGTVGPGLTRLFLILLGLIVVLEMPFMLFVLVRLARGEQWNALILTHGVYVAFPGVYGVLGGVLTGQRWWAVVMFFLCTVRLVFSLLALSGVRQRGKS